MPGRIRTSRNDQLDEAWKGATPAKFSSIRICCHGAFQAGDAFAERSRAGQQSQLCAGITFMLKPLMGRHVIEAMAGRDTWRDAVGNRHGLWSGSSRRGIQHARRKGVAVPSARPAPAAVPIGCGHVLAFRLGRAGLRQAVVTALEEVILALPQSHDLHAGRVHQGNLFRRHRAHVGLRERRTGQKHGHQGGTDQYLAKHGRILVFPSCCRPAALKLSPMANENPFR